MEKKKLLAALTPIAFFRAINGSYDLEQLRFLTYKEKLTDNEWQEFLRHYDQKLTEEKTRNQRQKERHQAIQKKLASKIAHLKELTKNMPEIIDVLLVNSYALGALKESSDIDLVVITKPEVLWWTRLKLTLALEIAGIRRKPGHIEEQICLSFFITEKAMNMNKIALKDDLYLHFWTPLVISLLGTTNTSWLQNNSWLRDIFPTRLRIENSELKPSFSSSLFSRFLNSLVRPIMKWRNVRRNQDLGREASIVISDDMFKFHNLDRRQFYKEKTYQELEQLLSHFDS